MCDSLAALRRIVGGEDPHKALVIFWLHRCRGMVDQEIADMLDLNQSTVWRHRRRVLAAIAECHIAEQTAVDLIESAA